MCLQKAVWKACHCCNLQGMKDRKNKWTRIDTNMLNVLYYFSVTAHHGLHTELANKQMLLCHDIERQLIHQMYFLSVICFSWQNIEQ